MAELLKEKKTKPFYETKLSSKRQFSILPDSIESSFSHGMP